MKGQAALEYIIIAGIVIALTIPVFYYGISQSSKSIRINEVNDAVQTLSRKADSIYALGAGSRDFVWITVPSGVSYTQIANNTILAHGSSYGDISSITRANITGQLPLIPGTYKIKVEAIGNLVYIGVVNDTTPPNIISKTPSGTITVTSTTMTATTDEPAICRYDTTDTAYSLMANSFTGSGVGHSTQLSSLSQGPHTYYARCSDSYNNVMTSSATISFTVNSDSTNPVVTSTAASPLKVIAGDTTCISATATDNVAISRVWASIDTPLIPPYSTNINFTLYDDGNGCDGSAGDNTYGSYITMQVPGNNTLVTVYANDTSGNTGHQTPNPNIKINVTSNFGAGPGQGFTYVIPNLGFNYKTASGIGYASKDSQMDTLADVELAITDDDKNTPPSSQRVYHTSVGDNYEGFIVQLNQSKTLYTYITLRMKVVDADVLPYPLKIYSYDTDADSLITTNVTDLNITHVSQSGVDRGFNEAIVTSTAKAGRSNYIRLRIMPASSVDKKVIHISEIDYGIS